MYNSPTYLPSSLPTPGSTPQQQAVIQTFLGRGDKALEILAKDTQRAPSATAFMQLARNQKKNNQLEAAEKSMEDALNLLKPTSDAKSWPTEAAEVYYNQG